jgi:hypothetical protein
VTRGPRRLAPQPPSGCSSTRGLDAASARADVDALHRGRVLVLVQSTMGVDELARAIDG